MTYHTDGHLVRQNNISFIRRIMKFPLLSAEQEYEFLEKWQTLHEQRFLDALINPYIRLSFKMAMLFRNYGVPLADLVQEGIIGLLVAANKFDLKRKVRFSTYACWWIRAYMQDFILKNAFIVKTGTTMHQKKLFFAFKAMQNQLSDYVNEYGFLNEDGLKIVAKKLGVRLDEAQDMQTRQLNQDLSLDRPLSSFSSGSFEEDSLETLQNMMMAKTPEGETGTPEEVAMHHLDGEVEHEWLKEAMKDLDMREHWVLIHRWLIDKPVSFKILADRLHLSKERVRQIELNAFKKLKKKFISMAKQ